MDKNNPLVTVILFTFNQESYIAEAVESVLNQTYQRLWKSSFPTIAQVMQPSI